MEKVVIVLGNTVTALGVLRACKPLKKAGYQIYLVSTGREDNIAGRSNISDKKIVLANGLVNGLVNLARTFTGKPILLFTRDDEVVEISKNRENLAAHYRFLLPDHEVVMTLMEKGKFAEFAECKKLPTPHTAFIDNEEQLLAIGEKIAFPVIIKPYLIHAVKIGHEDQLKTLAAKLEPVNYQSMIAQEYIEGADDQLFFCFLLYDAEGKLARSMYARKLRQWPVSYGTTSLAMTIENDKLAAEVEKFTATTSMAGFCSIEYKYDAAHDRYLIMEPTVGRFNQQIALTIAAGVNFPLAVVRLLSEKKVAAEIQKNNVLWIYESNDFFAALRSKTKYGYLKNFFKPHIAVLFASDDLRPLLYEIGDLARKKMKKIFRHV